MDDKTQNPIIFENKISFDGGATFIDNTDAEWAAKSAPVGTLGPIEFDTATTPAPGDVATLNATGDKIIFETPSGGSGITDLTGDVTATGPGSAAATIASNAVTTTKIADDNVTYAKMQNTAAGNVVLGNATASAGNISEIALALSTLLGRGDSGNLAAITLGAGLAMTGTVLSASGSGGFTAASVSLQTFTASGTYTRPANTQYALVVCVGGGGGGGGAAGGAGGTSAATGGGGSGAVTLGIYSAASLGASAAVTIGAAGAAGASTGGNGGTGGATSFGALTSAAGGSGGDGATASASFMSTEGGTGGTGGSAQIYLVGNDGAPGLAFGSSGAATPGYGAANPLMGGGGTSASPANTGAGGGGARSTTINTPGSAGSAGYCFVFSFVFS